MCVEIWKKFFLFLFDILDFKRNFKFQAITSTSDFFYFFNGLQAQAYFLQNAQKKRQAISRLSFQCPITLLSDYFF